MTYNRNSKFFRFTVTLTISEVQEPFRDSLLCFLGYPNCSGLQNMESTVVKVSVFAIHMCDKPSKVQVVRAVVVIMEYEIG